MTTNLNKIVQLSVGEPSDCRPHLVLTVPDGTNFFDIKPEDFELVDYDPVKPLLCSILPFSDQSSFFDALIYCKILSE